MLSPPLPTPPISVAHARLTPQYATPSKRGSIHEAPPPFTPSWNTSSAYPAISSTSVSPNASISAVTSSVYQKKRAHSKRRASCIPFEAIRKQNIIASPQLHPQRSCFVSLSESAAVSVSGWM